ncbi:hypothetical protein GVAV_002059 [Gurleya vavrai]
MRLNPIIFFTFIFSLCFLIVSSVPNREKVKDLVDWVADKGNEIAEIKQIKDIIGDTGCIDDLSWLQKTRINVIEFTIKNYDKALAMAENVMHLFAFIAGNYGDCYDKPARIAAEKKVLPEECTNTAEFKAKEELDKEIFTGCVLYKNIIYDNRFILEHRNERE